MAWGFWVWHLKGVGGCLTERQFRRSMRTSEESSSHASSSVAVTQQGFGQNPYCDNADVQQVQSFSLDQSGALMNWHCHPWSNSVQLNSKYFIVSGGQFKAWGVAVCRHKQVEARLSSVGLCIRKQGSCALSSGFSAHTQWSDSDWQSSDFRADTLQACPVLQTYGVEPADDGECDDTLYEGLIKCLRPESRDRRSSVSRISVTSVSAEQCLKFPRMNLGESGESSLAVNRLNHSSKIVENDI